MNSIEKLTKLFGEFPGIGKRQSKRFVYFLLTKNPSYLEELTSLIKNLSKEILLCNSCYRYFPKNEGRSGLCSICSDVSRSEETLVVVSRDIDFENMERASIYNGKYFILGGSIPILEKSPEKRIRIKELLKMIEKGGKENTLKEVVLALSMNPEGENTMDYVREEISPQTEKYNITVSTLGRGLATGSELEYSDSETLKNALKNRK